MSEQTVQNGNATEQQDPDPFDLVSDSRIEVADVNERNTIVQLVKDQATKVARALVTEENATKKAAWFESFLSSLVISTANVGYPDWSGDSQGYTALVVNPRNEALGKFTDAQARKARQNIRAAKGRGGATAPILLAIVRYCLTHDEAFAEVAANLKPWQDGLTDAVLAEQAKNPSDALVAAVLDQYRNGFKKSDGPPKGTRFREAFDGDQPDSGAAAGTDASRSDTDNASRELNRAVLAVPKVQPLSVATAVRDMFRGLVHVTTQDDFHFGEGNRAKIAAVIADMAPVLVLYGKYLNGAHSDTEFRRLVAYGSEGIEQAKPNEAPTAPATAEQDGANEAPTAGEQAGADGADGK